jgi:DNA-directed RNA polymerase specialized sigma24 family protein
MERILATEGSSPSASAQRRDLGVVLSEALAQLSEEHREVLVLHHLEGAGLGRGGPTPGTDAQRRT